MRRGSRRWSSRPRAAIEDIYELTYIRKDGSRFPAVVSVTALRDAQDAIIGYLLISTDNNARKQAEEALLKTGALQSAIFNSANFSSIATDAKGVIQIFNVGAERMLGYTAAEVMNKITPADISDPQEVVARAKALSVELGTPITPGFEALVFKASRGIEDIYELTYIRKDGSRFPAVVSVTALRDAQDAIIGYLLIGTDNTARKQAEEALLKAGALQSAIFNSANFSSIATDAKGVIQIFNVGAERMLGYTAAEVMNKITPADISDPQEVIARAKALSVELGTPITPGFEALVFKASRGIEDIYELTYIRKDGSRFPAVVSVTALRDAQDAIIGYLLIGTDNTARKQAEEALRQGGRAAERDLQQRQLLEHRHRRQGRHPDLQRRRRADAGLRRRRGDEQDHAGRHLRSAGSHRARHGAQRRARHADHAGLRGAGVQGLARDRGHLRADLHPQGRQPVPGGRVGHGAARRAGRHHRLPPDRHRQHRAPAGGRGAAEARPAAARPALLHALAHRIQHRRPDDHATRAASSPTSTSRPRRSPGAPATS